MANIKITDLPLITGITINDVIPIVDVDTVVTSKVTIGDLKDYIDSPFTGGTVSGDTEFTNGLTATTISASTYLGLSLEWTEIEININSSQIQNMGVTPIELLPQPGIDKYYEWEIILERIQGSVRLNTTDAFLIGSNLSYFGALVGPTTFFIFPTQYVQLSSKAALGYVNNTEVVTIGGNTNEAVYFTTYSQTNPISVSTIPPIQFKAKIKYKINTFG